MSALSLAPELMRQIAEPAPAGDSVKAAIDRVYRAVQPFLPDGPVRERFTYARVENIWRGESRRIDADEMDAIRAAHERRNRRLREELEGADRLASHYDRMAARLVADQPCGADSAFGDAAAALREAADETRRMAHSLRRIAEQSSAGLTPAASHERGRA